MLSDGQKDKKFDVRVIEKHLARGVVTSDEAVQAVKKLKDDADNAIWVNIQEIPDSV